MSQRNPHSGFLRDLHLKTSSVPLRGAIPLVPREVAPRFSETQIPAFGVRLPKAPCDLQLRIGSVIVRGAIADWPLLAAVAPRLSQTQILASGMRLAEAPCDLLLEIGSVVVRGAIC